MNKIVSVDCEVFKSHLVCVGLSFDKNSALSIPLINLQDQENTDFSIPLHDMAECWSLLAHVLADENIDKLGQNFHADQIYWLEKAGFEVRGKIWDLTYLMHTIYPELPKRLQFSTSIYTEEPYYKSEGRNYNPKKDKLDVLLKYNGMDCCVTLEAFNEAMKDCEELGLRSFYEDYMMRLYHLYGKMERKGIRVNLEEKARLSEKYKELLEEKEKALESELGFVVNYNSPRQVSDLVYGTLKCPYRAGGTDEETLVGLMNNAIKDARRKNILSRILELRKLYKAKHTYIDCRVDPDGRIRCEWKPCGTETGRSSTAVIKSPLRNGKWGIALQTLTKYGDSGPDIRRMFIPDEGKIFMEVDKAQAESRVADVLAEDYDFLSLRDKTDTHKIIAAQCFNLPVDSIDNEQRQVGKRASHAYDNGVGKHELSVQMTKEMSKTNPGFSLSEWRAGEILKNLHLFRPKIEDIFHQGIQDTLANNQMILRTPPFGRYRQFLNRWGRDLFKEAYAHIKQAIVTDDLRRGLIHLDDNYPWIDILVESHDGCLLQFDKDRVVDAIAAAKEGFLQEIDFSTCTMKRNFKLTIPIDIKVGYNWLEMEKI